MSLVVSERRALERERVGTPWGRGEPRRYGTGLGSGAGFFLFLPTPDRYFPASRSLRASASTPTGIPTANPTRFPLPFAFQLDFQPWRSWLISWLKAPPSYDFC